MFPRVLRALLVLCAFALPAFAQTPTFVSDSFTVTADTPLEQHAPEIGAAWAREGATGKGLVVKAATHVVNVIASDWDVYLNGTPAPGPEYFIKTLVTFTNNSAKNFVEIYARASPTNNNCYMVRLAANGAITIFRYDHGVPTTLAASTVQITLNTAIALTFVIDNDFKRASIDGATAVNSYDNTLTGAGQVGLGMQSYVAGQSSYVSFAATQIAP